MPGLFDPEVDPSVIEGGGVPLELPQASKPAGSKWKELAPLLAMLPLAAKGGGRVGVAALLQGFQQARQQREQQGRLDAKDAQAEAYRQAQLSSLESSRQAAQQNAEAGRQQQFVNSFQTGLEGIDNPEALAAYIKLQSQLAQSVGLRDLNLESMAPAPTVLQQRAAKKRLADLEKQFGAGKLMEMGPQFTYQLPGEPQPVAFDELLRRAGQSRDPNFVAPPAAPKDKRGFSPKEITLDGGRTHFTANYDPDTGQYYGIGSDRPLTAKPGFQVQEWQKPDKPDTGPRQRYNIQTYTKPDGQTGFIRVNLDTGEATPVSLPDGAGAGNASDTQRLSRAYLDRTTSSDTTAKSFEAQLAALGSQLDVRLPNLLKSSAGQQYQQAKDEFINAALRRESGAAIQPSEYTRFDKIYFVMPGDTAATIKQKQIARKRVIDGFRVAAGNLGTASPSAPEQTAPTATGGIPSYQEYLQRQKGPK